MPLASALLPGPSFTSIVFLPQVHLLGKEYLQLVGLPAPELIISELAMPPLKSKDERNDVDSHINVLDNEV